MDFGELDCLENVKSYVEHVNLLEQSMWAPEVLENSKNRWHRICDGRYSLLLPRSDGLAIYRNLLGQWAVTGTVLGTKIEQRALISLADAFRFADAALMSSGKGLLQFMLRVWPNNAATIAQKRAMRVRGINYEEGITKEEATKALDAYECALWNIRSLDSSESSN